MTLLGSRLMPINPDARLLATRRCSNEQSPDAHRGNIVTGERQPSEQALQHPVKSVQLRRTRTAWQADDVNLPEAPEQQHVAGFHRHAEMADLAAGALKRRGNHVTAIDYR